jgi:hypothetical protein
MRESHRCVTRLLVLMAALSLSTGWAVESRADFEHTASISADKFVLRNLIGRIEIEGHRGSAFEVEIQVRGADASPDRVTFESDEGAEAELRIVFPLDESRSYVYPRLGSGKSTFATEGDTWLGQLFSGNKIKVSGKGSGLEIWADAVVRVPSGKSLVVDHGAGEITARGVEANLELSTRSGPVEVADATGAVSVDTGSGRVSVNNVRGAVSVDTGSGKVTVEDVEGEAVSVDTGSGRVKMAHVRGSTLEVDTGSGGVEARGVGADELKIDTGSGSVELQLDRMGPGRFEIDTGSGSIDLQLPPDASARVDADTGNGRIRLDLGGDYRIDNEKDDSAEFTIGGGEATLTLDTGSGSIHVSQGR